MHIIVNVGVDGSELSASRTDHFTPGRRAIGTHWIEVWVGLRAIVGVLEKNTIKAGY